LPFEHSEDKEDQVSANTVQQIGSLFGWEYCAADWKSFWLPVNLLTGPVSKFVEEVVSISKKFKFNPQLKSP